MYFGFPSCAVHLARPSGIHGHRRVPRTAILATGLCESSEKGSWTGPGFGTEATTARFEGCNFGSKVEELDSAVSPDCNNRWQP